MVKILVSKKVLRRVSLQKFDELLHSFRVKFNSRLNVWELV